MIRFEKVTTDRFEFENVTFRIPPGALCKIILHSRHYRKVFLNTMLLLQKPAAGTVFLFGKNGYSISGGEYLKIFQRVGVARDDGGLISNLNIWENVTLPALYHRKKRPEDLEDAAIAILSGTGMAGPEIAEYMCRRPGHLPVHKRGLAGLVRAMLTEPELIVYDGLFEEMGPEMAGALKTLATRFHSERPGRTSVFISTDDHSLRDIEADIILRQEGQEVMPWRS